MKNLGKVSNFIEMGQILFGPDTQIQYEYQPDHEISNNNCITFYLKKEIAGILYTAEKQYIIFETLGGILLDDSAEDIYFEKLRFSKNYQGDCLSFVID